MTSARGTATRVAGVVHGAGGIALALTALLGASLAVSCGSKSPQPGGLSEEQELRAKVAGLARQEQLLSAELALAKSPSPYLSVDLANKKVDFKIRGRSLRSFPIAKFSRTGGSPFVAQAWSATEARPLQLPERSQMIPGSGEATTSSIATKEPWGPRRMPSDFDLVCKDNRALVVRSLPSQQTRTRFTRWIVGGYRQTRDWLRELIGRKQAAYSESVEIWLSEDDARLLFWSLPKQFGILLTNGS